MFRRFLSGFITCFPFICFSDENIKFFPTDVYKNDWKVIGDDIRNIINSNNNF
jgi:hypothetical protein